MLKIDLDDFLHQRITNKCISLYKKIFRSSCPFLTSQGFLHESFDGMLEDLIKKVYTKTQYEVVFDLDLVEYHSKIKDHSFLGEAENWNDFGWIELTPLEQTVLDQLEKS